jgi:phosphohistidine phosphatase
MSTHLNLLRHADAGDPLSWRGNDAERPLSAKGHAQMERLTEHLAGARFEADLILTSPKVRARETAEPVAKRLGVKLVVEARLGAAFDLDDLEALLRDHGDPTNPVFVGHDPDFSEVLSTLVGAELPMKKAALARLEVERPLAPGVARLQWLLPPDALRRR